MQAPNVRRARYSPAAHSRQVSLWRRGIQIGPRIRVGGDLGRLGESIKQNVGQAAKIAAVPVSFVNPALGAALAVGGRALHTNEGAAGIGDLVGAGVKNYATGQIGGKLLAGVKRALPTAAGAAGGLLGGGSSGGGGGAEGDPGVFIPGGAGDVGQLPDGTPSGGGGGIWDTIAGIGRRVLPTGKDGGIDWLQLGAGGLAALQGYNSAQAAGRAGDLENEALAHTRELWESGKPLREQGMAGILNPRKVALDDVYSDPTNPFAQRPAPSVPGAPPGGPPKFSPPPARPTPLPIRRRPLTLAGRVA